MYNNYNNQLMNQLYRQRENIENLITQYSQPQPQAPVQNIINTTPSNNQVEIEGKILKPKEDVSNILVNNRTIFIDESNAKIYIKEIDGTLSKTYDIIIPKDEKDLKIEELEKKLKELEEKVNVKYAEPIRSNDDVEQSTTNGVKLIKPTTTTNSKSSTESTKGKASGIHSATM